MPGAAAQYITTTLPIVRKADALIAVRRRPSTKCVADSGTQLTSIAGLG
jgi:hypothetical protein